MAGAGKKTILLVEDDPDNREIIAELLDDAGYHVVSKINGAEALEHLKTSEKPSVILLDLMMPGMDGWSFVAAQRDTLGLDVPLVVISAISNVETRAADIPAAAYLQKPVDLTLLLETVQKVAGPP
jgi:CheY-like chemotaxis protein